MVSKLVEGDLANPLLFTLLFASGERRRKEVCLFLPFDKLRDPITLQSSFSVSLSK